MNLNYDDYEIPTAEPIIIADDGSVVTESDLVTPFMVMKSLAEKVGAQINDPSPSCKHCYGRGYVGRDSDTKAPIPCTCIMVNRDRKSEEDELNKLKHMSRSERRSWERTMKKYMSKQQKSSKEN